MSSESCSKHMKECNNPECNFRYFEEQAYSYHLSKTTACNSRKITREVIIREVMAISSSSDYNTNDFVRRDPNLPSSFKGQSVLDQGRLIPNPNCIIINHDTMSLTETSTHRMMNTINQSESLNNRTFSTNSPASKQVFSTDMLCQEISNTKPTKGMRCSAASSSLNLQHLTVTNINENDTVTNTNENETGGDNIEDNIDSFDNENVSSNKTNTNDPDTEMLEWAKGLLSLRSKCNASNFSSEEECYIELMEILDTNDIPFSVFEKIVKWSKRNKSNISTDMVVTRDSITKAMNRKVHGKLANRMNPVSTSVHLPSGHTIQSPVMDIRYHIVQKLIDPELMQDHNLLFDLENPLKRSTFTDNDPIGDVNTGTWQQLTEEKLCKEENEILCPLIFFIDSTTIDTLGKQNVEPVTSTLAIFNRRTRNKPNSWFHLGAIENASNIPKHTKVTLESGKKKRKNKKQKDKEKEKTAEQKALDYNCILSAILEPLKKLQKRGGFKWYLPKQDLDKTKSLPGEDSTEWTEVIMKVPVQFIIGDTEGHDKLCGMKAGHATHFLMRDCNVKMKDGAKWNHVCEFYTERYMKDLYKKGQMPLISFNNMKNPWWEVEMGGDGGGIYKATFFEILHQFHSGIVQNIIEEIENLFSTRAIEFLDRAVRKISIQLHRQTASEKFPTMRAFKKGLHPGNSMTHTEKLGRLTVVYLAMLTEDVSAYILQNGNKKSFPKITKEYYIRILQLLERTLGINSFLKAETMERSWIKGKKEGNRSNENQLDVTVKIEPGEVDSNEPLATKYFRQYMRHMQEVFPKQQGTPFKILQVRKNDTIYFNGSSKGKRYQWLLENDLLTPESDLEGTKKKKVRNEDNCMNFLDVGKVVQLMGYEVSIRGNGWHIPKFHAFLHLVRPILYMGVPENYNGARSESNLIENIKKPARRTNKHGATITFQTMLRYGEQRTRNIAYAMLSERKETHTTKKEFATGDSSSTSSFQINEKNYRVCGSTFSISFKKNTDSNDGYCVSQWEGRQSKSRWG